ncbi:glycosyltransferase [Alicyclobacillus tolerans]|uniref:UDP-D-galactose:(Glucosyl)LPS alpha-1,6-D-galactosyltransferase n=1 Tax=Alicyclobacillus tolerans TaxID=90970 RepID=A0ABT9LWJ6_9BACL|nr:glycosyltransferase [Alicyclobacillus tengchongensis]MDP9728648.1 UDP-D-galactose:(glucosyl)LPS alpha-1,6-D-galactosyltransferase [Alicyclobacillus tengchongensis]
MIIDIVLGLATGKGGLENVLSTVSHELIDRKYQVRIFQFQPPIYPEWLETLPNLYYYDPFYLQKQNAYPGEIPIFMQALEYRKSLIKMGKPNVILATHTPYFSLLTRMAIASYGNMQPPILSWLHGPVEAYGGGDFLRYADAHIAISKSVGHSISRAVQNQVPIYYAGNPAEIESIKPLKRDEQTCQLIYVGRLENNQKRLDVLLQALSYVHGNYHLTVIGDGPDKQFLQNLAEQYHISNYITWKGWQESPWQSITSANLLVLSSEYEGFGMVLVEALARGIPVISSHCEGPDEIVNSNNGWLFQKGNVHELANLLQAVLDKNLNLPDPESCIQSVQKYSKKQVVDRIEHAIQKTCLLMSTDLTS